ncbi:hypothetical protein KUTeg_009571 [Tegillarca granosa]|uniref:Uncharacterized protein n=1 Tax=Tegillarca granosa TaxID=220873 RepID=A0ABQ9F4A0_TEGGR|nr:hypothetical protein KUTeg_009571 [Tegillarca granosa]
MVLRSKVVVISVVASLDDANQNIFTTKQKASSFLHHRSKRDVNEECREGCFYEEVREVGMSDTQISLNIFSNVYERGCLMYFIDTYKSYMMTYKCSCCISCSSGYYCSNTNTDYSHINNLQIACKRDGGWSNWSNWASWSSCSATCEYGAWSRSRSRTCSNPTTDGGVYCVGSASESQTTSCVVATCIDVDGDWTAWSNWTDCSVTCSNGTMSRSRDCTNPSPQYGGNNCSGNSSETDECSTNVECPITCSASQYTCSGDGLCIALVARCDGTVDCSQGDDENSDGGWSNWLNWESWSSCSATCEYGTWSRSRSRTCSNPATDGGVYCVGSASESQTTSCIVATCVDVDGDWTAWSNWTDCSVTCGNGTISCSRNCTNPSPQHGGNNCSGNSSETDECRTNVECPITCSASQYTCFGDGLCIALDAKCDGTVDCSQGDDENSDGGWSNWLNWASWSSCSVTCEYGTWSRSRSRTCSNPTTDGGVYCVGSVSESQTTSCIVAACIDVDGGWTAWSNWTDCSVTCSNGTISRSRDCTNPSPQYGGNSCSGNSSETDECSTNVECPTIYCYLISIIIHQKDFDFISDDKKGINLWLLIVVCYKVLRTDRNRVHDGKSKTGPYKVTKVEELPQKQQNKQPYRITNSRNIYHKHINSVKKH